MGCLSVVVLAGWLYGNALVESQLVFAPKEGVTLRKTTEISWTMCTSDYHATMTKGQDTTDMPSLPKIDASRTIHISTLDKYSKLSPERVTRLERTVKVGNYSLLQSAPLVSNTPLTNVNRKVSPLEGRTVVFEWKSSDDKYVCVENDAPTRADESLSELSEETDYAYILPGKDHKRDMPWAVPVERISDLCCPGGNFFPPSSQPSRPPDGARQATVGFGAGWLNTFGSAVFGSPSGTISASVVDPSPEMGRDKVEVIHITIDVTCHGDMSKSMKRIMDECLPASKHYEYDHSADCALKGEGDIVWDIAAGHVQSVRLQLEAAVAETAKLALETRDENGKLVPTEIMLTAGWKGPLQVIVTAARE
jgi:hypothetical protein